MTENPLADLMCARCGRPVERNAERFATLERMH